MCLRYFHSSFAATIENLKTAISVSYRFFIFFSVEIVSRELLIRCDTALDYG